MKKHLLYLFWLLGLWGGLTGTAEAASGPLRPRRVQAGPTGCQPSFLTNNATTLGGLTGEYFAGAPTGVAWYNRLPERRRNDDNLNFATDASFSTPNTIIPPAGGTNAQATNFAARYRGSLYLAAGDYTFSLLSDDNATFYLGTTALGPSPTSPLINRGYSATPTTVNFTAATTGLYDFQMLFSQGGGGLNLVLKYAPGLGVPYTDPSMVVVPNSAFCAGPASSGNVPVAATGTNQTVGNQSGALALNPGLSATDADGNGTIAFYNIISLPTAAQGTLSSGGTPVVAGQALTPAQATALTFTPSTSFVGTATLTFNVTDNTGRTSGASAYASLSSAVGATYSIPVAAGTNPVAVNDAASTSLNTAVTFAVTGNDTFTAPSTSINTATVDLIPGTLAVDNTLTTAAGTFTTLSVAAGSVRFTPATGFVGVASATYVVQDNQNLGSNTATLAVTVAASCQPSYLDNTTSSNGLTAAYYATNFIQNGAGTADDRIALYNRVAGVRRTDNQVNFTTSTFGNIVPPATGSLADPDNFSSRYRGSIYLAAGDYTFQVFADDAAYLWLGASALAPTAATALITQTGYTGAFMRANFTAPTTGLYDLQLLHSEGGGGNAISLAYAPGLSQTTGFVVVPDYALCAGPAAANAAPTATTATNAALPSSAAATTLSPGLSASDSDGSIAYYQIITLPTGGVLASGGVAVVAGRFFTPAQAAALTFDPSGSFTGTTSFTFAVIDDKGRISSAGAYGGTGTAPGTTYTIPIGNVAPTVANITNTNVANTSAAAVLSPNLSATDPDGSIASFTVTGPVSSGTLRFNGTTVTGSVSVPLADIGLLTYQPTTGFAGSATFTFTATDNLGAVSASATYTIPVVNPADLATTLKATTTPGGAQILQTPQGGLVFFEATVTNNGPGTSFGTSIRIQLPMGLTGVSLSNSGLYNSATGLATFPGVDLASGASYSRNIAFTMLGTTVNGTATTISNTLDQNSANNIGSAFVNPTQVADVIVAINGPTRVLTNGLVLYTVVPTNLGPSTATGVVLSAQIPSGLTGVVVSNSGVYNATTGVVTWGTIGSLANGASVAYTVRFNAPATTGTILAPSASYSAAASATSTTADGDPVMVNNNGTNGAARITTQVVTQSATLQCIPPSTTDASVSGTGYNSYYPGLGTVTAGSTTLSLGTISSRGSSTPIAANDLVVIMQMQGSDLDATNTSSYGDGLGGDVVGSGGVLNANFTAGTYEYATVTSFSGGTLTLTQPLGFGYSNANATSTSGQRRYQVLRIPLYRDVNLTGDLSAPRWDGYTGGVLVMDVNGTLNLNGYKLDLAGKGFRGAAGQQLGGTGGLASTDYRTSTTLNANANKGEGIAGTPRFLYDVDYFQAYVAGGTGAPTDPVMDTRTTNAIRTALLPGALTDGYPNGDRGRGAPGNAGGGGTDGNPSGGNDQNTGGGGGSNAGRGGVGGNAWDSNRATGGFGGADFTQATASRIIMGGGGGAGTTNNGTVASPATYPANTGLVNGSGFSSSGAAGGGIVLIRATTMGAGAAGTGTIDVSGASMPFVADNDGSGGGGAGGSVLILCNASNNNPSSTALQSITVLARGGNGGSNTGGGSPHGPGGGGAGGVAFTSSVIGSSSNLTPGANGLTFGFAQYGSGVGDAAIGQVQNGITRADVPNIISACPADVVTTLSTNVTSQTPGSPVILTVTTVNNGDGIAYSVGQTVRLSPNLLIGSVQINGAGPTGTSGTVATYPGGITYDSSTGIVTFPAVATLAVGALPSTNVLTNTITFSMPNQTVLGISASTSVGDLDPRVANNDGSLAPARVTITAINALAGRVFDDVNYGGGSGRPFATADASATAAGFAGGAIGSAGSTVELYTAAGAFYGSTTTGVDGSYGFAGVPVGNYQVRVVNSTVRSVRNPGATGVLPVQTFRTNNGTADPNRVGGENPAAADGVANTGSSSVTLNFTGLGPNTTGNDVTAYVDQVEIIDVVTGNVVATGGPANTSFETPAITANTTQYNPSGATWTFQASSGLNGSGIANGTALGGTLTPPFGTQAGFVQGTGSFSQSFTLPIGTYRVRFRTAQRNNSGSSNDQTVSVSIGSTIIGSVTPAIGTPTNSFTSFSTGNFTVGGAALSSLVAESLSNVTVGSSPVSGVDFGFNFDAVVNTNNAGQGSLRQFITNANALPNGLLDQDASSNGGTNPAATIETSIFMIPDGTAHAGLLASGSGGPASQLTSGVAVITPTAALPALTATNTTIDGTTQTLNIGNTNNVTLGAGGTVGTAATALATLNGPEVQVVGTPGLAGTEVGLSLENTGLTVRGLSIYGFGNTGGSGTGNTSGSNIRVTTAALSGTLITGNVIGSGATAFADPGSSSTRSTGSGILLTGFNTGTVSAQITNNLIGFNGTSGIADFASATPTSVNIQGNEIRGNAILNLTSDGVRMATAGGQVLNNLIVNNQGSGVDLAGTNGAVTVSSNTIQSNGLGGTETAGVRAFGQGNTVSQNVVRNSAGDGILVRQGTNTTNVSGSTALSQNAIYNNGQLGINLLAAGDDENTGAPASSRVTINDLNDADGRTDGSSAIGGNGLLNFPLLQSATLINVGGIDYVRLNGFARPGTRIELFNTALTTPAATADASGYGEGAVYLSQVTEGGLAGGGNIVADTDAGASAYSGLINGLNQGSDNTNRFTFTIPLSNLPGVALGSVLTATGSITGVGTSEFSGNVPVVAPVTITGTIFDDVNYGGGLGRNYTTANASATASGFSSAAIGSVGTTVEAYSAANVLVAATTTTTGGVYTFTNLTPGTYTVRVVNSTVHSVRSPSATGVVPVQTFRTNNGTADPNRVGGENPGQTDAGASASGASLTAPGTLYITGLNTSGGDNTAFVDQVEIVNVATGAVVAALTNPGFETPSVGTGNTTTPAGATWIFANGAGIAGNGSGYTAPTAPQGTQVAYLQGTNSSISQALSLPDGAYQVRLRVAQRNCCATNNQTLSIRFGANSAAYEIGQVTPANNGAFATYTSGTFGPLSFQSIASVPATANVTGVDFGYNFDVVTNTNDSGQGSVRQFIANSNTLGSESSLAQVYTAASGATTALTAGRETSIFMIPNGATTSVPAGLRTGLTSGLNGTGGNAGAAVITLASALPAISGPNTSLDATTQTTNVGDSNAGNATAGGTAGVSGTTVSSVPRVEVAFNNNALTNGLTVTGNADALRGFAIYNNADVNGGNTGAILVNNGSTTLANQTVLSQLLVGTLANGSDPGTTLRNQYAGVRALSALSLSNSYLAYNGEGVQVGSGASVVTYPAGAVSITNNDFYRNGGGQGYGDQIALYGINTATVSNNLIREAQSGTGTGSTAGAGVKMWFATTNATLSGNSITASTGAGVVISQGSTANVISQNVISGGVGRTGEPSSGSGIQIGLGDVGGTGSGIVSITNRFTQNSIYGNAGLGIDITTSNNTVAGDGVTANDGALNNAQPNRGIDYPILNTATSTSSTTATVTGFVGGAAAAAAFANATIEFYLADNSPANNDGPVSTTNATVLPHGEGRTYLGSLTADSNGNFSGTLTYAGGFTSGAAITATAYLASAGSSEFGPNLVIQQADVTTLVSGPAAIGAGQVSGNYTVSFTNNGPLAATAVTQSVTLPVGATLSPAQQLAITTAYPTTTFGTAGSGAVIINFPTATTLAAGASNVFQFALTAPTTTGSVSMTSNVGTTSVQNPNTAPDSNTFAIAVTPVANVAATITPLASPVTAGQTARFDVSFTNAGPSAAAGVTATVQLPVGLTGLQVQGAAGTGSTTISYPNGATYNTTTGLLTFASTTALTSGQTVTSYLTYTQPSAPSVTAVAAIQTTTSQGLNGTADDAQAATILTATATDLTVSLSGPSGATRGGQSTYTVTTSNVGVSTQPLALTVVNIGIGRTNVFVSDGGTYDTSTGDVTFPAIVLTSGQSNTRSISFTQPGSGASLTVTANVSPLTGDPTPANNTASLTTTLSASASAGTANLFVLVSASAATIAPGGTITYTVNQGNGGPAAATGVATTLALAPGSTGVVVNGLSGGTPSAGIYTYSDGSTYNANTGLVTFPAIASQAPTAGTTVTNTVAMTAPATGLLTATAGVTGTTPEAMLSDNQAQAQTLVLNATTGTDVVATISGPGTASPGERITYAATMSNAGAALASSAVQTVQLPAGLPLTGGSVVQVNGTNPSSTSGTVATYADGSTYDASTGLVTFPTVATLAAGGGSSNTVSLVVPQQGSGVTTTTLAVTTTVRSTTTDLVPANNSARVLTTVQPLADVQVVLSGPATAVQGSPLTYFVTTTNNGPAPAGSVAVTVQLPANLGIGNVVVRDASGTVVSGAYTNSTGLVTFAALTNMQPGATNASAGTISFPAPSGVFEMLPTAQAAVSGGTTDPALANNASVVATTLTPPAAGTAPDVEVLLSANVSTQTAGAPVTFTVTTQNNTVGTPATGVLTTVQLPAGLTGVTASGSGSYNPATGVVAFSATGSLVNATPTVNTITVNAPGTGPLVAVAASPGASTTTDPLPANNVATSSVTITSLADVQTVVSGPATAAAGAPVSYTAVTTDLGPSPAATVQPSATIPTGLALTGTNAVRVNGQLPTSTTSTVASYADGSTYNSTTGAVAFPALATLIAGQPVTNMVSFLAPTTSYTVLADASTATTDPVLANNSASQPTTVPAANLAPVAQPVVNTAQAPRGNTANSLPIASLAGADADGSVVSYTIQALPPGTQGVLYVGGTELNTANFPGLVLTPTQAGQLQFDAAGGFVGNVFFTYTATDNGGAVSNAALYTIPVGLDNASVYTPTPSRGGATAYVTNDVIAFVVDGNGARYPATGPLYNATTGVQATGTGLSNGLAAAGTNAVLTPVGTGTGQLPAPSGNATNSLPAGLSLNPATGQIYVSNAAAMANPPTARTYTVNITTTDVYGGITMQPVSFTIGAYPLPVELTVFTAEAVRNVDGLLSWTTASEKHNDHFEVERSLDGRSFTKIGTVQGQGSKATPTDYALTDANAARLAGTVYYRLRQVDVDGAGRYSPVRAIRFTQPAAPAISLWPNPAVGESTLDLSQLPLGTYEVRILDATGRTIVGLKLDAGSTHQIDLHDVASGAYFVVVRGTADNLSINLTKRLLKN